MLRLVLLMFVVNAHMGLGGGTTALTRQEGTLAVFGGCSSPESFLSGCLQSASFSGDLPLSPVLRKEISRGFFFSTLKIMVKCIGY